jgi:hypothetical protein
MEPLGIAVFIFLKIQRLWISHVVYLGLDEHETVYIPIETLEPKLKHIKLVIEHKRITDHLNL